MSVRPTVYIESSVISYLAARASRDVMVAGHQVATAEWWDSCLPKLRAFISPVVIQEVSDGDPEAAAKRQAVARGIEQLDITDEVTLLAREYFDAIVLPESARGDALHLALATCHGLDYLVTWNCRHLANERVRRIVREINDRQGLGTPMICTPEELLESWHVERPDC